MDEISEHRENIANNGFTIVNGIYTDDEVGAIIEKIENTHQTTAFFRKTSELFAIRQFLNQIPDVKKLIFNDKLRTIILNLFGLDYFIIKSIYFDKPEKSNWFVNLHQDLTISVDKKVTLPGFCNWTIKNDQFAVQPPLEYLQNIFTIRIHLDDTNGENGALKVVSGSHRKNVCRIENKDWPISAEIGCDVKSGGLMIMRPLLIHASNRTTNNRRRRVIHLEFSSLNLPDRIKWAEKEAENSF